MNWTKDITNWRELGEAIASFNSEIGSCVMKFTGGMAEFTMEDGTKYLEIHLVYDPASDVENCCVGCHRTPNPVTMDNPTVCTNCFKKVCIDCWNKHARIHLWESPVQKTIGGDIVPF